MAKIGVRKMFYAKYVSDGVYSDGAQFGKISSFNYTPTVSSVKDYGDDVVAEVSNEQSGGTLAIEANQLSILERAYLLGHELSDGVMVVKADDAAPYVGVGALGVELVSGVKKFVAKWYKKLMFKEPNDENATKQENTSFAHTSLEADVVPQTDYAISETKVFDSETAAVNWLKAKANISGSALDVLDVTSAAGTSTGYTAISATGHTLGTNEGYVYTINTGAVSVEYGDDLSSWTDWDGADEISSTAGLVITLAVVNSSDKAVAAGHATIVVA